MNKLLEGTKNPPKLYETRNSLHLTPLDYIKQGKNSTKNNNKMETKLTNFIKKASVIEPKIRNKPSGPPEFDYNTPSVKNRSNSPRDEMNRVPIKQLKETNHLIPFGFGK